MKKPDALVNPADQRSGGNCGVTAVSIAAGISFQQAWDLFVKHCPRIKRNKKWSGGTYDYEREIIMEKLKIKYQSHSPLQILHMLPSKSPCNFTLEYFTEWGARPGQLYIITTTQHVQILQDGWVIDQNGPVKIGEHWGRKKRVMGVEVITPKRVIAKRNKYAGAKLQATVKTNPRKEGSFGYHSMKIIMDNPNILYEDYIAKGGRLQDLKWDLERGWVELK